MYIFAVVLCYFRKKENMNLSREKNRNAAAYCRFYDSFGKVYFSPGKVCGDPGKVYFSYCKTSEYPRL
jgi:hypothetical protein